jgi:2-keto-4-pentenoate hydratase/2-oxohepta-3-ene-1,7-dioic acid hydratase in catechol pathway
VYRGGDDIPKPSDTGLQAGDEIELEIEDIGVLRNRIV